MNNDYITGGHHFWVHFSFGLVVGAGLGLWIGRNISESSGAIIAFTASIALVTGYACGRWGDSMWNWILWCLRLFR